MKDVFAYNGSVTAGGGTPTDTSRVLMMAYVSVPYFNDGDIHDVWFSVDYNSGEVNPLALDRSKINAVLYLEANLSTTPLLVAGVSLAASLSPTPPAASPPSTTGASVASSASPQGASATPTGSASSSPGSTGHVRRAAAVPPAPARLLAAAPEDTFNLDHFAGPGRRLVSTSSSSAAGMCAFALNTAAVFGVSSNEPLCCPVSAAAAAAATSIFTPIVGCSGAVGRGLTANIAAASSCGLTAGADDVTLHALLGTAVFESSSGNSGVDQPYQNCYGRQSASAQFSSAARCFSSSSVSAVTGRFIVTECCYDAQNLLITSGPGAGAR